MSDFLMSLFNNEATMSRANQFGGQDFIGSDNELLGHSEENIFGGEDIFDSENGKIGSLHENQFGGQDLFDFENEKIMSTHENIFGGEDFMPHVKDWQTDVFSKIESGNMPSKFKFPNLL